MNVWTAIAWGVVSVGGALVFLRLVADAVLLTCIGLEHRERSARRAEDHRLGLDDQARDGSLAA